ncbi:glycosyltransferase family 4 protein [Candidimonas humi]|uniref:Glycosyltransferase family 4 protein n=1 Tax=Candidimonas humi TaxID=683355 RepID=A0ABV8NXD4_9BURK|nr:glycosyltransferase family 4 protein [Candidimonas humi]MBV6305078.1 glycosyltransferase family 4 protein [Candidimonas humi]
MAAGRFLLISSFADSLTRFRGALIDDLRGQGLEVHVAAPDIEEAGLVRKQLEEKGVVVHSVALQRTGLNPVRDLNTLYLLWRLMRRIRPDYTLGYTIKPVVYGLIAAFLARIPNRYALITGLGYTFQDEDEPGLPSRLLRQGIRGLYSLALGFADGIFFQNPDDAALFRSYGILRSGKRAVVVNGSGVDISAFSPAPFPPRPVFLLIARLLGDKGVREYVLAAGAIRKKFPGITFNIVGWIDENPNAIRPAELEQWIASGSINYIGRLQDVRPAIAACSVYVLPSYREGTPRTVLEAMAMGRPIITTDAPGCRETVVDGENGFLVPPKAVDELAEAMTKFIDDPGLIETMGRRSREIAESKYDVHKVNAAMLGEMGIMDRDAGLQ